mgnify:CR=1 FL=1
MTIRNEYKQLKKENDLIFSTLAECDRDTITGIVNTISNTNGINYEIELVRKDLIAMAASAEADGQYLPAVIGDVDAFNRNLLASMPQPKLIDYMLDSLVWLCLFGLAVSLTHLLLGGPWDCYYDAAMLGICIVVMMPSAWLLKRLVPSAWLTADKGGLYGAAQAAVLVAGHHGAATSTSGALLRAVRPEAVFISAGADNRFGHPAAQTLARIRQSGAAVYRTDLSGTITIRG